MAVRLQIAKEIMECHKCEQSPLKKSIKVDSYSFALLKEFALSLHKYSIPVDVPSLRGVGKFQPLKFFKILEGLRGGWGCSH